MKPSGSAAAGAPAAIAPYVSGPGQAARPTISVVIPTYEPERFLVDAIRSVLAQDPGAAAMQIAIVDDGSKRVNAADLLAEVAPAGRIEYYDRNDNIGLAGNWNRAIALARGKFVHILHQDDTVRDGFYTQLLAGLEKSDRIGMAFCRHAFIDASDRIQRISHREQRSAGVLPRWLDLIAVTQRIQCPAAIVRRDVYETLGGFRADLRFALDWEMWVRIASRYDVWYEPQLLANYRRHDSAETARLQAAGRTTTDMVAAIEVFAAHLPETRRDRLKQKAFRRMVRSHTRRASKLLKAGAPDLAMKHVESARLVLDCMAQASGRINTASVIKRWMQWRLLNLQARLANRSAAR